ncbi:unnamed protein product [Rotaria sp. Silwood2]|nr:unnamed protein product [Rotaria sp. Silwood2]
MVRKLISQLFSDKCQLILLRLDIGDDDNPLNIHECLTSCSHPSSTSISNKNQYCCWTLRYLYVGLKYTSFLEHLIEHIPNIERLSVSFKKWLDLEFRSRSDIQTLIKSNGNWFEKVSKLNYFALKVFIHSDFEFAYLKWILNNLNHIEKFKLHLVIHKMYSDTMIKEYIVDANFIRQYCLSDVLINIKHFQFYIVSECQLLLSNNIEQIINSFKTHQFFIDHQWTNVTCLFDPYKSYQHLSSFSSNVNKLHFMNGLVFDSNIFTWPFIKSISIDLHPFLYLFLEQFNELFPNVSHIKVYTGQYFILLY